METSERTRYLNFYILNQKTTFSSFKHLYGDRVYYNFGASFPSRVDARVRARWCSRAAAWRTNSLEARRPDSKSEET